ncbi:MAG: 5-carboxymethyl-2-hydroxymuconate isomerase [Chlorobi bacterium]|nr:5-carboxymethyl-2-hydroxymuconate isomerase [Chlorobiota bacterium]
MPHIILQYTDNIKKGRNFNPLFSEIHSLLSNKAGIDPINCKSRAIKLTDFFIGEGDKPNAFVHLEIRIFQGRTPVIKQGIGNEILKMLKNHFQENLNIQFTIEIVEMDKELYFKS